ncbi:MAG: FAD-dependent oxidoreductase [Acidobacteriota bacterium]
MIGGGPTGVELAGAISDIAQLYMKRDFRHIDPRKSRVLLLDGGPRILASYSEDLSANAEATLSRLGVEVRTHTRVTGVGPGWVTVEDNQGTSRLESAVTLWAAGVEASPLGRILGAPLDRRGCVGIDDKLNPRGWMPARPIVRHSCALAPSMFAITDSRTVLRQQCPPMGCNAKTAAPYVGSAVLWEDGTNAELRNRSRRACHAATPRIRPART